MTPGRDIVPVVLAMPDNLLSLPAGCEVFTLFEAGECGWVFAFPRPVSVLKGTLEVCCVDVELVLLFCWPEGLRWLDCRAGVAMLSSDEVSEGCIDLQMSSTDMGAFRCNSA